MAELKALKKGDKVILHMFTGMSVGIKEITAADAKTVTINTRIGDTKFSKKTGLQVEPAPKQEKYANFITEDDGSFVPPQHKKKSEGKPKKSKKTEEPTGEDENEEAPAPKKTSKAAKKTKKDPEPVKEDDEEFDEDDFEEIE